MQCRLLTQADFKVYDDFLKPHTATSMFLRSNPLLVGMDFKNDRFHAHYYGLFDDDNELHGVIALCWNGNVFVQVPNARYLEPLFTYVRQQKPDFVVKGVLGPDTQSRWILDKTCITPDMCNMSSTESVFTMPLDAIHIPAALMTGAWVSRRAQESDLETLTRWRRAYEVEALGMPPEALPSYQETEATELRSIKENTAFVLEVGGALVGCSKFSARLPDAVQIGGVYTPPEMRKQRYGRACVAGSLLMAADEGTKYACLFTTALATPTAYTAIGFRQVGSYHLTLLKEGVRLGA
ncbi:MAG: GNAT family N-acetyltransferase [Bdellovibrionales bacterium]